MGLILYLHFCLHCDIHNEPFRSYNILPTTRIASIPTVNLKFETFFHSHVAELIKGLNRTGIPGLLNLANQSLGNAYLHSPWTFDLTISKASTGPAWIIESGFQLDRSLSHPGNFEAVVLEGNSLIHYWHNNSDTTSPWIRANSITDRATGPGSIIERKSNRFYDSSGKVVRVGDFKVVVLEGNELHHYSHDNSTGTGGWVFNAAVTYHATSSGCIIEGSSSDPYGSSFFYY